MRSLIFAQPRCKVPVEARLEVFHVSDGQTVRRPHLTFQLPLARAPVSFTYDFTDSTTRLDPSQAIQLYKVERLLPNSLDKPSSLSSRLGTKFVSGERHPLPAHSPSAKPTSFTPSNTRICCGLHLGLRFHFEDQNFGKHSKRRLAETLDRALLASGVRLSGVALATYTFKS